MAQLTSETACAEPAVSAAHATPLALGVFAFTTAILGSIFAGFLVPSESTGITLLAAVAFFRGLVQLWVGLGDVRRDQTLTG